jgi:hypothetical protein
VSGAQITIADEGQTQVQVIATDDAGNSSTSPVATASIDETEPTIAVAGSLANTPYATLPPGSYGLTVTATDQGGTDANGNLASVTSGVASIGISVDGTPVSGSPFPNSGCTANGCPQSQTESSWSYSPTPGAHTIEITATDQAGNSSTYDIEAGGQTQLPAAPTQNYSLSQAGLHLDGATSGDLAGSSIADIGDVNGDGIEDYAIGAPNFNNGAGAVFVILGQSEPATVDLATITPTSCPDITNTTTCQGFRIDGAPGSRAGTSVMGAGDINGDGSSDFLIGAPGTTQSGVQEPRGSVYAVFGGPSLQAFNLANIATAGPSGAAAGFRILGPCLSGNAPLQDGSCVPAVTGGSDPIPFGTSLAGGGAGATATSSDINGDGLADIVLGESDEDGGQGAGQGAAWVIFGKSTGGTVDLGTSSSLGNQGFEIEGPSELANAGASVSMAGDQNGDGLADIAIAAPGVNCGSASSGGGAVYVLYGTASSSTIDLSQGVTPSEGYEICGNTGDLLGSSTNGHGLADIGDVNTDGLDDLAIGGNGGYVVFGQSSPTNIDLADINPSTTPSSSGGSYIGYRLIAPGVGYGSGSDVFSVGDLNGDDTPDVAITDPTDNSNAGDAYVVYGKADNAAINLADLSAQGASDGGELGFHAAGVSPGDMLGTSAIGTFDAADAGTDDLLLGAPGASNDNRANSGSTYLVSVAGTDGSTAATSPPSTSKRSDPYSAAPTSGDNPADYASGNYGLTFGPPCDFSASYCPNADESSALTEPSSATPGPVGLLAQARDMHYFRYGVPWNAALPSVCLTSLDASGNHKAGAGYDDPATDCGNLKSFLTMVKNVVAKDSLSPGKINIEINLSATPSTFKMGDAAARLAAEKTVGPQTAGQDELNGGTTGYYAAIDDLTHYVNVTLAQNDGTPHVQFWGAWNEPDVVGTQTSTPNVPFANPGLAASYVYWAHNQVENQSSSALDAFTGCQGTYSCVVVAGEFAFVRRDSRTPRTFIPTMLRDLSTFTKADHFTPRVWSYHAYLDVDDPTGDPGPDANPLPPMAMGDTITAINMFKNSSQWRTPGEQVWMTEGAYTPAFASLAFDAQTPPTYSNGTCSAPGAIPTHGIETAVDRFLALTTGDAGIDAPGSGSALSAQALVAAHDVSAAFWYEVSAGGGGGSWMSEPCPDYPVTGVTTANGQPGLGSDYGLYEGDNQAPTGTVSLGVPRPRYAFCLLTSEEPSNTAPANGVTDLNSDCQNQDYGTNIADTAPLETSAPSG